MLTKFELEDEDLKGHSIDDLKCNLCAGANCPDKVHRAYDDNPVDLCLRLDATREVLELAEGERPNS